MDLLNKLSDQGLLGLLLAISIGVIAYLFRALMIEKDKRIAAAEKVRDDLIAPINSIKDSINAALLRGDK